MSTTVKLLDLVVVVVHYLSQGVEDLYLLMGEYACFVNCHIMFAVVIPLITTGEVEVSTAGVLNNV